MSGSKVGLGIGAGVSGAGAAIGDCRPEGIVGSSLGSTIVGALERDLVVTAPGDRGAVSV